MRSIRGEMISNEYEHWLEQGESCPKQPKGQKTVRKVMVFFWDGHDIIFINYIEKGKK